MSCYLSPAVSHLYRLDKLELIHKNLHCQYSCHQTTDMLDPQNPTNRSLETIVTRNIACRFQRNVSIAIYLETPMKKANRQSSNSINRQSKTNCSVTLTPCRRTLPSSAWHRLQKNWVICVKFSHTTDTSFLKGEKRPIRMLMSRSIWEERGRGIIHKQHRRGGKTKAHIILSLELKSIFKQPL